MKIVFCIRSDYLLRSGGDTTQLLNTIVKLEQEYNLDCRIITDPISLSEVKCDVIHIFNIQTIDETYAFIKQGKKIGAKIALSTIVWDYGLARVHQKLADYGIYTLDIKLHKLAKQIFNIIATTTGRPMAFSPNYSKWIADAISTVDLLLPNSLEEVSILANISGLPYHSVADKSEVVYNGVTDHKSNSNTPFSLEQIKGRYILEVGRIEPLKNQLGLLRAFRYDTKIPIVFIGNQQFDIKYCKYVKKMAKMRGNVVFINELPHDELTQYYRNALVHVLPSFSESTGIVSLEALSNMCPAVISQKPYCPVSTYFEDITTTADPFSPVNIRSSVYRELGLKRNYETISKLVMNKFNWSVAANQTFAAYKKHFAL